MKSKVWLLTVCILASIPFFSWSANEAKDTVVVLNDSISLEGYDPRALPIDSTAIFILDDKLIPYKDGMQLYLEAKTITLIKAIIPKEAVLIYGNQARGGAVRCRTINTEMP